MHERFATTHLGSPLARPAGRGADPHTVFQKLTQTVRDRESADRFATAVEAFKVFALDFKRAVAKVFTQAGVGTVRIPFATTHAPEIVGVMHAIHPSMEMHNPHNGKWHLGLRADGELVEFRWVPETRSWETQPITVMICLPESVYEALDIILRHVEARVGQAAANADQIAAACNRESTRLKDTVRS